jgi:hypothetical protein
MLGTHSKVEIFRSRRLIGFGTCITWHKLPEKTHQLSIVKLIDCRAEKLRYCAKLWWWRAWFFKHQLILVWRNTDDVGFHKPPICTVWIISGDFFWVNFLNLATIKRPLLQLRRFFFGKNSPLSPHYEGNKIWSHHI